MPKIFLSIIVFSLFYACKTSLVKTQTAYEFQAKMNTDYNDPDHSPLTKENLKSFTALDFFPINDNYIVNAKFTRAKDVKSFKMKTTTDRLPVYELYGKINFSIDGTDCNLNIYQSHRSRDSEKYKDYLFLPFYDDTNGDTSYGGGRYIDLKIPSGDTIIIDFNQAYNPYCAYNSGYSCPITPKVNTLALEIKAGVMKYEKGH